MYVCLEDNRHSHDFLIIRDFLGKNCCNRDKSFNRNGRKAYVNFIIQYLNHLPRKSIQSVRAGHELQICSSGFDLLTH